MTAREDHDSPTLCKPIRKLVPITNDERTFEFVTAQFF